MSGKDAKALALSVLHSVTDAPGGQTALNAADGSPPSPQSEPVETPASPQELQLLQVQDLIDLYFVADDPVERDVLFDKLDTYDTPLVHDFLVAMLAHDEDEFMRLAAAQRLAQRGHRPAIAWLEARLQDQAVASGVFVGAYEALSLVHGPQLYPTLCSIWRDLRRPVDHRRDAMLAMEALDKRRALQDFADFVAALTDMQHLPEADLEHAMAAFGRHLYEPARPALQQLRARVQAHPFVDRGRQLNLLGFVDEGLLLLATD